MNLGKSIKHFRKSRGITQEELCSKAEISTTFLSQIENGKNNPSVETMEKIADILRVPVPVLHFYAIEKDDVSSEKKDSFDEVFPLVDNLIKEFI